MKMITTSLTALIAASFAPPALSFGNPSNPITDLLIMGGKCIGDIEIYGKTAGIPVCNKMSNTLYKDGRTGFYFVTENYILTFSGVSPQVKKSSNSAVQPVDLVLFNETKNGDPNNPMKLRAAGTCDFANPFLGVPVTIDCKAETSKGRFAAKFISNGAEPVIMIKNGKTVK